LGPKIHYSSRAPKSRPRKPGQGPTGWPPGVGGGDKKAKSESKKNRSENGGNIQDNLNTRNPAPPLLKTFGNGVPVVHHPALKVPTGNKKPSDKGKTIIGGNGGGPSKKKGSPAPHPKVSDKGRPPREFQIRHTAKKGWERKNRGGATREARNRP